MKKENDNTDFSEDFLSTSSSTDMTGLIPAAPANADETLYYEELYPFLPQANSKKEKDNKIWSKKEEA